MPDFVSVPPPPHRPLVLTRVSKRYPFGPVVLRDLSHTFEPGTATGLVGPNGAGKSTLLRVLSALSRPTSGTVRYGGPPTSSEEALDVHAHPHRYLAHVGVVHDGADLPPYLTAEETLEWIARERGTWDDGAPTRHAALLDAVLLDERRRQPVGTYSAGMTRKTQWAVALAGRPSVLLLDEPFRALDVEATEAALALLAAFRDGGGLVVLSSHRADLLDRLCDTRLDLGVPATAV